MVPTAIVELDSLPLTPSGKLDRRALPPASGLIEARAPATRQPRSGVEEVVCSVLAEVLKVRRVGPEDNFFELGGHSLVATRAASKLREAFGVEVGVREVFERPTGEGLAEAIRERMGGGGGERRPAIERVSRVEQMGLSSSQQRLWFLHQLEPHSATYNIAIAIHMSGALDVDSLEKSISEITRRHEVLRTSFATIDGQPAQVISEESHIALAAEDLSGWGCGDRDCCEKAHRGRSEAAIRSGGGTAVSLEAAATGRRRTHTTRDHAPHHK